MVGKNERGFGGSMPICVQCNEEFEQREPIRTVQKFCCEEHRKAWHYRKRKRTAYRTEVEAAERMNGHGPAKPEIDLVGLGLASKEEPLRKGRRL